MDLALAFSALLLGLAGAPHCAAMCGPSCVAVLGRGQGGAVPASTTWAFHGSRIVGYAVAGALAAGGVAVLSASGSTAPLLRPLWTLMHIAALALGMWLLWTGRQPAWMTRIGRTRTPAAAAGGWQPMTGPLPAAAAGSAWVAWPCGLLQSALVVAALANTPQGGALVMAAFAVTSAAGLQLTPWLAARLAAQGHGDKVAVAAVRLAGAALVVGSGWAFGHDVWGKVVAYCTCHAVSGPGHPQPLTLTADAPVSRLTGRWHRISSDSVANPIAPGGDRPHVPTRQDPRRREEDHRQCGLLARGAEQPDHSLHRG